MEVDPISSSEGVIELANLCYRVSTQSMENGDIKSAISDLYEAKSIYRTCFAFRQGNCLIRLAMIAKYTGKNRRALHFFKASVTII